MWVLYRDKVDDGAKYIVQEPWAVYIEQVYKTGNFSLLNI